MSGKLEPEGVRLNAVCVLTVQSLCSHVLRSKPGSAIEVALAQIILKDLKAAPPYFGHLTHKPFPGESPRPLAGEPDQDPQTGDLYGDLNP